MARPKKVQSNSDDDNADFSFDPGTQIELEMEDTCCVTGEPVEFSFCRFPDYKNGTLMVMSKSEMLEHLRSWRLHRQIQRSASQAPRQESLRGALLQLLRQRAITYIQRRDGPQWDHPFFCYKWLVPASQG